MERVSRPADGLAGLRQNLAPDLLSGFLVFLIALPLSVGIALASGAPSTAGLLAAIVGGLLGALIGGSHVVINGPAAGLIVIVLGTVTELGSFRRALAAFVVAGVMQIGMGLLRLGRIGVGVPGSVIHGMLAAIGVIIMVKQLPVALGVPPVAKSIPGLVAEIPRLVARLNPEIALIAVVGFLILVSYKTFRGQWVRYVPAQLLVVVVGILLARLFQFDTEHMVTSHSLTFKVGPKLLLKVPETLANALIFPDFSGVFSLTSLRWSVSLALVASIESLLTSAAVDRLDPHRRASDLDRELVTKGICNTLCGLIGALPIIAEIVRSQANVSNGARTRWANFFHGFFILGFLALFPDLLQRIPLAALATLLIAVGYALGHPEKFLHTAKVGNDHFAAFLVTFLVTLVSDLLVGVAAGILTELAFNLLRGAGPRGLFRLRVEREQQASEIRLRVRSPLVFTNSLSLKRHLEDQSGSRLVLDLSGAPVVDHTALDQLHRYQLECRQSGRLVVLAFSEDHTPVSSHPLAARRLRARKG